MTSLKNESLDEIWYGASALPKVAPQEEKYDEAINLTTELA